MGLGQEIIDFIRGKDTYFKRSFAQAGEDVIILGLVNHFKLINFSWIDVGAHHPSYFSNTALFYNKGYRGINIEADPNLIGEFYRKRPNDINLNVLISDKNGEQDFYIIDPPTLSTLSKEEAYRLEGYGHKIKKKITVNTITVIDIVNKYSNGDFPCLLTLDAEGYDFEILKTIDWEKTAPKIICVEIVPYTYHLQDNFNHINKEEITAYLLGKGYFIAAYTGINAIFVDKKLIVKE